MRRIIFVLGILLIAGLGLISYWQYSDREYRGESVEMPEVKMKKEKTTTEQKQVELSLTTVYDNYPSSPGLRTGWGFSCLLGVKDKNILFDTGADSSTLLSNMEKLGIDPQKIDIVVLSHIHQDHVGGLSGLLEKNPNVEVFLPVSFPQNFKNEVKSLGARVVEVGEPMKISEDAFSTGELGTLLKEQSLMVNTAKGLVVVTGCAHPGVVKIVRKAKEITENQVYLVIGGFHLSSAGDSQLKEIISDFRQLGVQKVAPCHCSGDRTRELFNQEYKNDFIENGVGKGIEI